jgi:hypothetical protein
MVFQVLAPSLTIIRWRVGKILKFPILSHSLTVPSASYHNEARNAKARTPGPVIPIDLEDQQRRNKSLVPKNRGHIPSRVHAAFIPEFRFTGTASFLANDPSRSGRLGKDNGWCFETLAVRNGCSEFGSGVRASCGGGKCGVHGCG